MGVSFLKFGGSNSQVRGLGNVYVWGLVFLRLEVKDSYVWGLVFLRLGFFLLRIGVSNSFVWGLDIHTFGGLFSYVSGLGILTCWG